MQPLEVASLSIAASFSALFARADVMTMSNATAEIKTRTGLLLERGTQAYASGLLTS
jgi:hypothetical protein